MGGQSQICGYDIYKQRTGPVLRCYLSVKAQPTCITPLLGLAEGMTLVVAMLRLADRRVC